jgi:hypothetical protein
MDLVEIGLSGVDWIGLAQVRGQVESFVSAVMNIRVPYKARKSLNGCTTDGHLSSARLHRLRQLIS